MSRSLLPGSSFLEEEEGAPGPVDLDTPEAKPKQAVAQRPVARPLAALKQKLAKSAASMRAAKAASGIAGTGPQNTAESKVASCPRTPDAKSGLPLPLENTADTKFYSGTKKQGTGPQNTAESEVPGCPRTPDAKSMAPAVDAVMAEGGEGFITRREQLLLQPKAKAKGKAKAKAKAGSKKAAKNLADDEPKSNGLADDEPKSKRLADDEPKSKGRGGRGKAKTKKGVKTEKIKKAAEPEGEPAVDSKPEEKDPRRPALILIRQRWPALLPVTGGRRPLARHAPHCAWRQEPSATGRASST